jgi:hypothetical protein
MPGEFGRYIHRLLRLYNMAQVALERTGAGVGSLEALLNCGYPGGLIYHRSLSSDQDPVVRSDKIACRLLHNSRRFHKSRISKRKAIPLLDASIALTVPPNRAMHGWLWKLRLGSCG